MVRQAKPTPYEDLNAVLSELVAGMQACLSDTLAAVCLQGSFAVGDFDRHSDVDWVAVVERELVESEVQALQVMHGRTYDLDCAWAQHLEGSYFPRDVLWDRARRGEPLWYLDNGSRSLIESSHCNTIVVRSTVRDYGVPLLGPDPATLVESIPVGILRQEMFEDMHQWGHQILADPARFSNWFYQTFIVLHYCRALHALHMGRVGSKRAGAEWAKKVLDPCWIDLIDRAWDGRPIPEVKVRQPADPRDMERTLEFVQYVLDESERYAAGRAVEC